MSTMVGPHITAAAAEAAVTSLCDEYSYPREIFDGYDDDDYVTDGKPTPIPDSETKRLYILLNYHFRCFNDIMVLRFCHVLYISESSRFKIQR